jgi:oligogalacturonide lyase
MRWTVIAAALCAAFPAGSQTGAQEPPRSWIDADTGHRVVRLTNEPGSASLYFNQNGYTADGLKMVYTTPRGSPPSIWRRTLPRRWSQGGFG